MKLEVAFLALEIIILSGFVVNYLVRKERKIGKGSMLAWGVLGGCSTLLVLYGWINGEPDTLFVSYILECFLSYFGAVMIYYARKYEKRMLGLYAIIMAAGTISSLCLKFGGKTSIPSGILSWAYLIFWLLGGASTAVLCCLGLVGRRRPAKVRRFMRISFLCLGAAVLFGALYGIRHAVEGQGYPWEINQNMVLVTTLFLCGLLHRKRIDTRISCFMPFALTIVGLLIRYEARIPLAGLLGGGIGAVVVLIIQSPVKLPEIPWKNTRAVFCLLTCCYASLLLLGTLFSFWAKRELDTGWYDVLTIGYCILSSMFLVKEQTTLSRIKYVAAIVWDILIIIGGAMLLKEDSVYVLSLLWISVFPILCFFLHKVESFKEVHAIRHLMCSLCLLGVIAMVCGGLGGVVSAFFIGGVGILAGTIYSLFFGNL